MMIATLGAMGEESLGVVEEETTGAGAFVVDGALVDSSE
jgi:hypothetical protein